MPIVRYTFQEASGERFHENYHLQKGEPLDKIALGLLEVWSRNGDERKLADTTMVDMWTHEHTWFMERSHKSTSYRDDMRCLTCGITGKRKPNKNQIDRDEQYKGDKYEYCHEQPPRPAKLLSIGGAVIEKKNKPRAPRIKTPPRVPTRLKL